MFKNSVLKISVSTKDWIKASSVRAIKTVAQTAIGVIGSSTIISAVDWKVVISASVLAGILSILTSVAGIPEVEEAKSEEDI